MQISSSISIWSTNYIPVVSASGVSYFLDLYSAEYAYSLRQLGSTEVDVIRVRRSSDSAESDFNPTEISDGTLTTWTGANDGFVVTWYDQAGSNDFTQSTAGNQPKIVSSGTVITKDSLPAVSFDGTSDFLQGTIMSELESSPFSVFTVCNNGGNSLDANTMFSQRENGGAQEGFLMTTDRRTDKIGAYTDDSGAAYQFNYLAQHDNSDNRLQAFIINGSDQGELWLDSTSQDTNTHSSFSYTASQAPFIGKQDPGTNQYGQGKVQEIIVFGTDEGTDRSNIENNMNEAYNMFWNGQNTSLLDTYSASSAYSLRALNSSYTGALVRIRRSSDSAERDFYANWDGSFPSTDVENWVGAGNDGFVVTWYDQEESADMTQSTAANQPRIVNAGTLETKGGKTAVYFDGSNDYVSRTSFTSLYTYPFTIMGVSSNDASAAQGVVFSQRLSAGDQSGVSLFCDRRTNKTGFLLDEGSTNHQFNYTAQDNTANQRLQTFIIDSSGNGELWKDGTSQESIAGIGAFSTNPSTVADIGRQQAGPLYIQGFVQELIVWGSTDQTSNRTAIENNINENYDLYWNGQNTSLLDDYGSAAAAYSLRNLDSSYTGALVRIRRSSDSAERDFYGTWNGEFPTTAVQDWVGANDGFVVTWYDQSGNSNDVTQATAANQPKLVNVGSVYTLNGKPTLSFDATNDVLSRAAITALNTEPVSYFTVYQSFTADTNSRALFNTGSGATDNSRIMGYDGSHTTVPALSLVRNTSSTNYYTSASPSLSVSTPYLQTGVYDSGKGIESWIDGSSQGTTTFTGTYVNDTFELGAMTNISIYKDGSISEFIIYASDQTSNRTDIETNINDHYSIY